MNPVCNVLNDVLELLCFLDLCFEKLEVDVSSSSSFLHLRLSFLPSFLLQGALEGFFELLDLLGELADSAILIFDEIGESLIWVR